MLKWFMFMFPDSGCEISKEILMLHDYAMMILLGVLVVLLYLMIYMMMMYSLNRMEIEGHLIEVMWTLIPMILLIMLAFPSLSLLYKMDNLTDSMLLTVKILGNQWYWTYEIEDNLIFNSYSMINKENFNKKMNKKLELSKMLNLLFVKDSIQDKNLKNNFKEFESYMLTDLNKSDFRLLDVDNRLVLPLKTSIRLLVTSNDVIHSWAVPSLGVKIDAVPGRLNQTQINVMKVGLFYGQCSEICGLNHSFMPIVVEVTLLEKYMNWFNEFKVIENIKKIEKSSWYNLFTYWIKKG